MPCAASTGANTIAVHPGSPPQLRQLGEVRRQPSRLAEIGRPIKTWIDSYLADGIGPR